MTDEGNGTRAMAEGSKGRSFGPPPRRPITDGGVSVDMPAPQEKLFVYQRALEAAEACEQVARRLPGFRADLVDQLRRASTSVPLNIAEGAGEFSPKAKLNSYRIARRSASECGAILDVVGRVIADPPPVAAARKKLDEVLALLTNTSKAIESRIP